MIGPLQEFQFKRLSSTTCIRLIKIHTELVRGDISCTLQQYENGSPTCPPYVALSYVWGDSTARHTIYINGLMCRVHHSLWQFLDRTRTDKALACEWFWTDLLCINQIHHNEKNEQVSRMGDIYAKAKYVISWLGEHTATVEAFKTFIELSKEDGIQFPHKYAWKAPESHQIHMACDRLAFEEPYWGRVWIMQEVACARICFVACGDMSLNFDDLLQKMETAMNRTTRFDLSSDRDRRMRRVRELAGIRTGILEGNSMSILDLIGRTSFCQATRDQDRIYGLLGLARRLDSEFDCGGLEVSYDKTLSDIWWDMIFMVLDDKSEISKKRDLMALKTKAPRPLPPPRKHLELTETTSIRRTQAEAACQVAEAAYSASVEAFLGAVVPDTVDTRVGDEDLYAVREGWEDAMEHICDHEENLPRLQTRLGRSALAGLQFTSWAGIQSASRQTETNQPLVLPSGWFCAAHLPDHLRNSTSKHRILPSHHIKSETRIKGSSSVRCSGAFYRAGGCDFARVVLELEPLGITCLVQRKRCKIDIEFYGDCSDSPIPCDKFDLCRLDGLDSDFEGSDSEGSESDEKY